MRFRVPRLKALRPGFGCSYTGPDSIRVQGVGFRVFLHIFRA